MARGDMNVAMGCLDNRQQILVVSCMLTTIFWSVVVFINSLCITSSYVTVLRSVGKWVSISEPNTSVLKGEFCLYSLP